MAHTGSMLSSMSWVSLLHAAHRHIQGAARVRQGVDGLQQGAADTLALEGRQHQHLAHAHAHAVRVAEEVVHCTEAALHAIHSPMSALSRALLSCCFVVRASQCLSESVRKGLEVQKAGVGACAFEDM